MKRKLELDLRAEPKEKESLVCGWRDKQERYVEGIYQNNDSTECFDWNSVFTFSPASHNNLAHGMGRWGDILQGDSEDTKEQNLNGRTRCIPKWPTDTILPGNVRGLKECCSPCPLRDYDGSCEPSLDHAASGTMCGRCVGDLRDNEYTWEKYGS